jgi:hypothetical protein
VRSRSGDPARQQRCATASKRVQHLAAARGIAVRAVGLPNNHDDAIGRSDLPRKSPYGLVRLPRDSPHDLSRERKPPGGAGRPCPPVAGSAVRFLPAVAGDDRLWPVDRFDGPGRIRTCGQLLRRQSLCPLSYGAWRTAELRPGAPGAGGRACPAYPALRGGPCPSARADPWPARRGGSSRCRPARHAAPRTAAGPDRA